MAHSRQGPFFRQRTYSSIRGSCIVYSLLVGGESPESASADSTELRRKYSVCTVPLSTPGTFIVTQRQMSVKQERDIETGRTSVYNDDGMTCIPKNIAEKIDAEKGDTIKWVWFEGELDIIVEK